MKMITSDETRICPLMSIASLIKDGPQHWHICIKECSFAREEGGAWWCAFVELASCAEHVEKNVRGY